jgi:hypothetical protein
MKTYHKIQTVFLRDPESKMKYVMVDRFAKPEFEYLSNNLWAWTEKVDGTNIRIQWRGTVPDEVNFNGKTDSAQLPAPLVQALIKHFPNGDRFIKHFGAEQADVCLYGEGYGAGIQKGGIYRPDQNFILFDVKVGDWWLRRDDVVDIAKALELDVVPIIGVGTLLAMTETVVNGFTSKWGDFIAEGIVARPLTELCGRDGSRIITKLKYKDFYHENFTK